MQASLVNFRQEPLEGCTRKILILGDMLELGDWSDAEHRHIISSPPKFPMPVSCWSDRISRRLTAAWNPDPPTRLSTRRRKYWPQSSGNIPYRRP